MITRISIIGLGLMGGSLGMAVKSMGLAERVLGYARREETRRLALEWSIVDEAYDRPEDAVKGADLVVICTPVLSIPVLAEACRPGLSPGCIVTDVGSTKASLVKEVGSRLSGTRARFVGSHPIAGSEESGLNAARADLYRDAAVIVTPAGESDTEAAHTVGRFWESVGAKAFFVEPEIHDALVARTSHIPHLIAAMLVQNAARDENSHIRHFCGPGFHDTTRVAKGSPAMWHDIVQSNRDAVLRELKAFQKILNDVTALVESGKIREIQSFLEEAKKKREGLVP